MSKQETPFAKEGEEKQWTGFDLDGTLAKYDGWKGYHHIGEPIAPMVAQLKKLHADGKRVKILTARVAPTSTDPKKEGGGTPEQVRGVIEQWCEKNIGFLPEITHEKDHYMEAFYDDRCIQVKANEGIIVEECEENLKAALKQIVELCHKTNVQNLPDQITEIVETAVVKSYGIKNFLVSALDSEK